MCLRGSYTFNQQYHTWPVGGSGKTYMDYFFLITSVWRDLIQHNFSEKYYEDGFCMNLTCDYILLKVTFWQKAQFGTKPPTETLPGKLLLCAPVLLRPKIICRWNSALQEWEHDGTRPDIHTKISAFNRETTVEPTSQSDTRALVFCCYGTRAWSSLQL